MPLMSTYLPTSGTCSTEVQANSLSVQYLAFPYLTSYLANNSLSLLLISAYIAFRCSCPRTCPSPTPSTSYLLAVSLHCHLSSRPSPWTSPPPKPTFSMPCARYSRASRSSWLLSKPCPRGLIQGISLPIPQPRSRHLLGVPDVMASRAAKFRCLQEVFRGQSTHRRTSRQRRHPRRPPRAPSRDSRLVSY